jgi:dipeptidase E
MSQRRLILAGGGDADDSRPLDRHFASWVGRSGKILYLPIAMAGSGRAYDTSCNWLRMTLGPFGLGQIEMWPSLEGKTADDLWRFEAAYIGGGNTFRLLQLLRAAGLDTALMEFMDGGHPVYGGSAGAVILGKDIRTAAHTDANAVRLEDTHGLDVARGYSIWCHYEPAADGQIAAFVAKYALPVLALSERGGAALDGNEFTAVGHDPAVLFTKGERAEIAVGDAIPSAETPPS